MLDPLAVELHQEFLDLAGGPRGFLVQRNTDPAVGRRHGARSETGVLALDVEVANLAEAEDPLVEAGPVRHPPAIDVVRQVIDDPEAVSFRMTVDAIDELKVDVVDRCAVA